MEKKCVIFVNSLINLILAVQLRDKMYKNCKFDIVISSLSAGLDKIYDSKVLEECFDNVFFVDYNKVNSIEKLRLLFNPVSFVEKSIGTKYIEYTDLFFWNPTLFFYAYLFGSRCRKHNINLHLYGDAMGAYVCDAPIKSNLFGNKLANYILELFWGDISVEKLNYDYYVFRPEFISFVSERKIVEIPSICVDDYELKQYLCKVFAFDVSKLIKQKYIFMDVVHKDKFDDPATGAEYIKIFKKYAAPHELILKPHPRQNKEIYKELNIELMQFDAPWELYCLNTNIDDKVVISFGSSSAFLPMILMDYDYIVVCIDLPNTFNILYKEEWNTFINKLQKAGKKIYRAYCMEELGKIMMEIEENEEN